MTVKEAAEYLGISPQRVRVFLEDGRLPAVKRGRDWWIEKRVLEVFAEQQRPSGRPRKS